MKKKKKRKLNGAPQFKHYSWQHSLKQIELEVKEQNEMHQAWGEYSNIYSNEICPVINEFDSIQEYDEYIDALIVYTKREVSNSREGLSKMSIAFKFDAEGDFEELNFVKFLFNIVMWRPFIASQIPVTRNDIFKPEIFHNKKYEEYFNVFADKYRDSFTMAEYSEILFDIQVFMNKIAVEIGPLFGSSISIYDMVKMAKRNNEINALMHTEVDLKNFKVSEVEEFLAKQTDRFLQILMNEKDKNNPLKPLIRGGELNRRQVAEVYIHLGFKPDLSGSTIPITTNSNFTTYGLPNAKALYIDAQG